MSMTVDITSGLAFTGTQPLARLDSVELNLSLWPRTDWRQVVQLEGAQQPRDGTINYIYTKPPVRGIPLALHATVDTTGLYPAVRQGVPFPARFFPNDVAPLTLPTEGIDSDNPAVAAMARRITENATELYEALHLLGGWIEDHINYSLDTLTADATQLPSWVLEKRYGVCDELTVLFIAMARSLGIPARYVSGVAFTNYNDVNDWGMHAWAEVYYPGAGWIPYDVTYHELGYVDATHIALRKSERVNEPGVQANWLGYGVDGSLLPISVAVKELSSERGSRASIDASLSMLESKVGPGSYNLVQLQLRNPTDSYVPVFVQLAPTEGLAYESAREVPVYLRPGEHRTLYWVLRVDTTLQRGYRVTFPVQALVDGARYETSFVLEQGGGVLSRDDVRAYMVSSATHASTGFYCTPDQEFFYDDEDIALSCSSDTQVCLEQRCPAPADGGYHFTLPAHDAGYAPMHFTAGSSAVDLAVKVVASPSVSIEGLRAVSGGFGDAVNVTFSLMPSSAPQDARFTVSINGNDVHDGPVPGALEQTLSIPFTLLQEGENDVTVKTAWQDARGREYEDSESVIVTLGPYSWWERVKWWFMRMMGG
ncbi:hypothetical protein AUJ68_06250 [Candidatus Woesearchaeota archaeon CG1_02_57_44]|nr:MAG: hypothetical protein AUJ68_06250 [Candidatus Woesearchaeota archaeon CG1_02_57_44]